jgi:ABC-type uncharacterized transport system auxiliary subunit
MKLKFFSIAIAAVGLTALSCGSVPEVRYYMVNLPVMEQQSQGDHQGLPVSLGVSTLRASPVYEDDRIIYRQSPYEVNFYHYRRWVVAPSEMVSEKVYQRFAESGTFAEVVRYNGGRDVDYVLSGDLLAFEEWDENDAWYAQVGLRTRLTATGTGEVVWEETFFRRKRAEAKDPVRVVEAMSEALDEIVAEVFEQTQQVISQLTTAEAMPEK